MADNTPDGLWQEDCAENAVAVSHAAGPLVGDAAAAATLAAAAAETEVPPAAYETAMQAGGAFELGRDLGGPLVGAADYGACATGHYAGEGVQYLNDEAHQGAQGVADYIDSHFIDPAGDSHTSPPTDSVPVSSESGFESFVESISSGIQSLGDEIQHAGHAVMEQFEPSDPQPSHEEPPQTWSPDQASSSVEGTGDNHLGEGSLLSSITDGAYGLADSAQHAEQTLADFWDAPVGTLPHEETASSMSIEPMSSADGTADSRDGVFSAIFGGPSDSSSADSSSGSHDGILSSLFGSDPTPTDDSHNAGFSSLFGGSSDSPSPDSSSDSHGSVFSSLFDSPSETSSSAEPSHSFFDSVGSSSHDSDYSSSSGFGGGGSDHESGSSSSFGSSDS